MNLYTDEEIKRIEGLRQTNDKLEEFFNNKRKELEDELTPLFEVIKIGFNKDNFNKIIDSQSIGLSCRQKINEQISFFLNRRSREEVKIKKLRQDKFIFYATGFGLKTNLSEKAILIDAHIAENDRNMQIIENYIDFLRNTSKTLESLGYTIKNIIELMNYLGR